MKLFFTWTHTLSYRFLLANSILFISLAHRQVFAQTPLQGYIISNQISTPTSTDNSVPANEVGASPNFMSGRNYDLLYGQRNGGSAGNSRIVTGFTAGGVTFGPYNQQSSNSFTKVVFNRKEPIIPLGNKYTALYEYSTINTSNNVLITPTNPPTSIVGLQLPNNAKVYVDPSFEPTLEDFMNSYSLNKGTDNIFVNDPAQNTSNNIERIDLVYSNGVIVTSATNRNRVGFLLNERGGNDAYSVAAITQIDGNNNVTGLGNLRVFTSSSWGQVGPQLNTLVIQKPNSSSRYQPSQLIPNQTVSGVFISLSDLQIPENVKIYGIAIFPQDATTDLLGLSNALTTTGSASGLDLMSGNFVAKDITLVNVSLSGNLFHDANGLLGLPINTVDGTGIATPSSIQLYANLLDENNIVVTSTPILSTGFYKFPDVAPGSYTVQITRIAGQPLNDAPTTELPTGWFNTGESNNGLGSQSDGTPNGLTSVVVANLDVENINFGIEVAPDSKSFSTTISSPSIADFITLNGGVNPPILQGNDDEDMPDEDVLTDKTIRITSVPLNTELYYDFGIGAVLLLNGTTIEDFNPSLFQIKFTEAGLGDTQTSFQYAYVDAAGIPDPTPATYTLFWDNPLPVKLVYFKVGINERAVELSWLTIEEINSNKFDVERSKDGRNWQKITEVDASGNVKANTYYNVTDKQPFRGLMYYRLKMIDSDETYAYSSIASVNVSSAEISIFPNPVENRIELNGISWGEVLSAELIDMNGRKVLESKFPGGAVSVKKVSPGMYVLTLTLLNQEIHRFTIIKR